MHKGHNAILNLVRTLGDVVEYVQSYQTYFKHFIITLHLEITPTDFFTYISQDVFMHSTYINYRSVMVVSNISMNTHVVTHYMSVFSRII